MHCSGSFIKSKFKLMPPFEEQLPHRVFIFLIVNDLGKTLYFSICFIKGIDIS